MAHVSEPDFWEGLYARGEDGWDLKAAAPPLVDFVQTSAPPRGRVLVPGCGRGHDARFLAAHGYDVLAVDFSAAALRDARALAGGEGVSVAFEERDVFGLGADHARVRRGVGVHVSLRHRPRPARGVRRDARHGDAAGGLAARLLLSAPGLLAGAALPRVEHGDRGAPAPIVLDRARVPAGALGARPRGTRVDDARDPEG
jgi:SAM-dependent methyltransferase